MVFGKYDCNAISNENSPLGPVKNESEYSNSVRWAGLDLADSELWLSIAGREFIFQMQTKSLKYQFQRKCAQI